MCEGHPHTPGRGLTALCTPFLPQPDRAARWRYQRELRAAISGKLDSCTSFDGSPLGCSSRPSLYS